MGVIAKSEWRGGEQKKLEKLEFDMPTTTTTTTTVKKLLLFLFLHTLLCFPLFSCH